jgi:hypothetical protein
MFIKPIAHEGIGGQTGPGDDQFISAGGGVNVLKPSQGVVVIDVVLGHVLNQFPGDFQDAFLLPWSFILKSK